MRPSGLSFVRLVENVGPGSEFRGPSKAGPVVGPISDKPGLSNHHGKERRTSSPPENPFPTHPLTWAAAKSLLRPAELRDGCNLIVMTDFAGCLFGVHEVSLHGRSMRVVAYAALLEYSWLVSMDLRKIIALMAIKTWRQLRTSLGSGGELPPDLGSFASLTSLRRKCGRMIMSLKRARLS
jgi:hypothetical protein